jgi:protein-L-isoaspartate(D-aspartate) O-methyltransferase
MKERLADFRCVFAQMVAARGGCKDPRIREAFELVPRHEFAGPGPWLVTPEGDATPSADPALVYQDISMGLAPERGITTGLPSLHARCLDACTLRRGERVVHIGAGSGYFTAILAELVGLEGSVVAYEIDLPLAERARELLAARPNVRSRRRLASRTSRVRPISSTCALVYSRFLSRGSGRSPRAAEPPCR